MLFGKYILSSDEQLAKAQCQTVLILSGIITLFSLSQPAKASLDILVTGTPLI